MNKWHTSSETSAASPTANMQDQSQTHIETISSFPPASRPVSGLAISKLNGCEKMPLSSGVLIKERRVIEPSVNRLLAPTKAFSAKCREQGGVQSTYLRKAAQIESKGSELDRNMSSFRGSGTTSVKHISQSLPSLPNGASLSELAFGGSFDVGEAVSPDLFFTWFNGQVEGERSVQMDDGSVQGSTPTVCSPLMSPKITMYEKANRWQGRRLQEDGDGAGKEWKTNGMGPKNFVTGVSRVSKVEEGQRSRNVRSSVGKSGAAQSAAKVYSQSIRLANMKASQAGRERERVAFDADSRASQAEEVRFSKSKFERQNRNGRTGQEQERSVRSGSTSRSSSPRVSGRTEVSGPSAKPMVARVAGKVVKDVGSETLKAGVSRDRATGGARITVATSKGDAAVVRQVHVSSGSSDGHGEERLGSGCMEASPALPLEEIKPSEESTSRSHVLPVRNPIWPVAYDQQKIINKVPETRPEVVMQIPPPASRANGIEESCQEGLKQTGCDREKWGVDVAKVASHLQWHQLGEASPSPKSVLDRAQSSSPESTEDESMEKGLSAAELKFLQGMTGPTEVANASHPVSASRANSAESLESASLAFMGETESMEPDLEYVRQVLVTSGFGGSEMPEWHSDLLAVNPTLFEQLEKRIAPGGVGEALGSGKGSVEQQRRQEERRQRMLLFDAVNEAMVRRLRPYKELPTWQKRAKATLRPRPSGRVLLQEVWAEIHDWPAPSSEVMYDILDDAARRDMVKGAYKWDDFGAEEAEVVFALEKAILEGLVEEVVREFGDIEAKRRGRRAIAGAS